jgi:hypothetical protein
VTLRKELAGAGQFVTDRRVESLLVGEARRRAVTRVFGIPTEEQSLLVTVIWPARQRRRSGGWWRSLCLTQPLAMPRLGARW